MSLEDLPIWIPMESPNLIINMAKKAEGMHLLESGVRRIPELPEWGSEKSWISSRLGRVKQRGRTRTRAVQTGERGQARGAETL